MALLLAVLRENGMVSNLEQKMAYLMVCYLRMALPLAPKTVSARVLQMVLLLAALKGNMME